MKASRPASLRKNHPVIVVPKCKPRRFYGQGVPGVDLSRLAGKLIVVEGADGFRPLDPNRPPGRMAGRQRPRPRCKSG